jgi:hypothetical protein
MTSADGIDVVMLTKNSNKPYFRRVLKAIKREIPVHHFIVADGYSTDGTVERRGHLGRQSRRLHGPEAVDIQGGGSGGKLFMKPYPTVLDRLHGWLSYLKRSLDEAQAVGAD